MDKKRPIGVIVIGVLLIIGGIACAISLPFFIGSLSNNKPRLSVEKYKELIFRGRQPSEAELKDFATRIVPQIEKMIQVQNEIAQNPMLRIIQSAYLIMGIIGSILGIGLIRLKEKARQGIIIFQTVFTLFVIISQYFMLKITFNAFSKYMTGPIQENLPKNMPVYILVIQAIFTGLIALLIIFYLSRPKIKEQFAPIPI